MQLPLERWFIIHSSQEDGVSHAVARVRLGGHMGKYQGVEEAEGKGETAGKRLYCGFCNDGIYNLHQKRCHTLHLTGQFVLYSHSIIGFLMHHNIKNNVNYSN